MFVDSIIVNEIAPLRSAWAPVGEQAQVPIIGAHDRRVLTGVLNIASGDWISWVSSQYKQGDFQTVLRLTRAHWRGWQIVLFLDRHSAQRANRSRALAHQLSIQLRWLPTACPELNPVDHLWRDVVQNALANEPTPNLVAYVRHAQEHVTGLARHDRLRKAGVFSDDFWLADIVR